MYYYIILVLSKAQKDLVSNPGTLLINYLAFLNKWSVISHEVSYGLQHHLSAFLLVLNNSTLGISIGDWDGVSFLDVSVFLKVLLALEVLFILCWLAPLRLNSNFMCRNELAFNGQVFVARISQDRIGEVYHKVLAIIVKYVVRLRHLRYGFLRYRDTLDLMLNHFCARKQYWIRG
jgi:hypothetical protein